VSAATCQLLLALDYGGTKHTAALLVPGERTWLAHGRVYSPPGADGAWDQVAMLSLARGLLAQHPGRLTAIGVSFGGPVDAGRGLVRLSHHVPGWEEMPLRDRLQADLGAPVAVDNDANVAALGEWSFGAGQGCDSLLYVTVSTGVGGGWVLGGRIWSGADGMAGEIGHIVVRPGGVPCVCGKAGCVEAEACGWGIAAKVRARLSDDGRRTTDDGTRLLALAGGRADGVTAQMVAQAAAEGDALAQELLYGAAEALGAGIGAALNLMNPERVVLGGGITKSGERWWQIVRETARAHALPQTRAEIVPAALGDDAPLWGAAALAESQIRA
jgi:glucokinase